MPNRRDVRNPKAEYLLSVFQYVVAGLIPMADGREYGFVSKLTPIQLGILKILEVPKECFSFRYISIQADLIELGWITRSVVDDVMEMRYKIYLWPLPKSEIQDVILPKKCCFILRSAALNQASAAGA